MEVTFTVIGEPKGKGRPRFVRATGKAITPRDTVLYENLVRLEYRNQCLDKKFGDDEMLEMEIKAFYRIPSSKSKKVKQQMKDNIIRPTKKPDMDNVVKIIADSLNNIAYKDDTQIVSCIVNKYYSESPQVVVTIKSLDGK